MSRSRKQVYGTCDRNPFMKNQANRRVRKLSVDESLPDGSKYKKYFCSYDICDFRCLDYTEKQFIDSQRRILNNGWYRRDMDRLGLSFDEIVQIERHRSMSK